MSVLILILCLGSCVNKNCSAELHAPYPIAGAKVADELDEVCRPRNKCSAVGEWLGRLRQFAEAENSD